MRHDKAGSLLKLARSLAGSAEGMTLDEMTEELGVARRTVERMRDALWDLFPAMEELPDPPHKRYRIPGGLDGFFQAPTTGELVELNKAADNLRANGAHSRAAALSSLEHKVRAAIRGPVLRRIIPDIEALVRAETIAVQAGPRPFEDEKVIAMVRQAVMAMQTLRFQYEGGSRPGDERDVAPYGLMFGRANYLVAAELGSSEPRNYRLDRINNLEILDKPAPVPADFNLQDYAARSFGIFQGDVYDIILRVLPSSAREAMAWRFHPTQLLEPQEDGSVIVRFTASGLRELSWHLFTWRDEIEIVSPESLRSIIVADLKAALARHES
jgi:predicted DNA-binding transcriptional regulator YafY